MDIIPLGHASFRLKGKSATVVTDPYDTQIVAYKFPKNTTAHIVTVSHAHPDHNFTKAVTSEDGELIVFSGPGEYEVRGVEISGIDSFHDDKEGALRGKNTIFKFHIDGLTIVHLGDLGHLLTQEQEELLDDVDILLVPCGGFYTIDAKIAAQVVTALEPSLVIPMHYQKQDLNPELMKVLTPVSAFLKEVGKEGIVPQPKLKVTKETLPQEMQVVILE
ncbi:MAG: MBL fold metallo-hydrolase [Patescibacteria group bacterium]